MPHKHLAMSLFTIFLGTIPPHVLSQGVLRGFVADSSTGERLVGANVLLVGTPQGASTDHNGEFRISSISAGEYTIRISYLGFIVQHIEAAIADDQTTTISALLVSEIIQGPEVVVTAQARGQTAAINQQISAKSIVNVISEEKIRELPDANAAEAIGRLPGVSLLRSGGEANKVVLRGLSDKYSSVTIDGVRIPPTDVDDRGVDLSTISQGSLAGVVLYKALTPDKDADAIAGSINLVTRKAPETGILRLDIKGDYNRLMNDLNQYDVSFKFGQRFLDDVLGIQVTGNIERRNRSSERFNIDYDQSINNYTSYEISDFLLEFTEEIRSRGGAGILVDVATPDGGSIRLHNVYGRTDRDYLESTRNYPTAERVFYTYRDREQLINTLNSSVRGENYLAGFGIQWGISYGQSLSDFPYDYYIDFLESSQSVDGVPIAGMSGSPHLKDHPEQLIGYALNNFDVANLYTAYFRSEGSSDRERTGSLDLYQPYVAGDLFSGEFKFGAKYRSKSRFRDRGELYSPYYLGYWQEYNKMPDGSLVAKDFTGTRFEPFYQRFLASSTNRFATAREFLNAVPASRNLFNLYRLYPVVDRSALRLWYDLNKNGANSAGTPEYYDNPSADADYYDLTERVSAAYVMNTLDFGATATMIMGVRVERERNDYRSRWSPVSIGGFPVPQGVTNDTSASYSETIVLPSVHVTVRPFEFMQLRLAAYRALARPDFNLRLEKYISWTGASNAKTLIVGNPKLKTAKAWNYEVNTSFFGETFGLISVSAFYKDIESMFHILSGASAIGNGLLEQFDIGWKTLHSGNYALTVPYNSDRATRVWGFELEQQLNLYFLPGFFKNFVISYNASVVRSETHLLSTTVDTSYYYIPELPDIPFPLYTTVVVDNVQKLEDQPEFYGNISLGYDVGGFSARLSLYHQAEYNQSFSATGRSDPLVNGYTRIDLALRQKLTDFLSVLVNVSNLSSVEEGNSIINRVSGYTLVNTNERYGMTADIGIKFEF